MYSRDHATRKRVAVVTLSSLLLSPLQPGLSLVAQQAPQAKPTAAAKPAAAPGAKPASAASATTQPVDGG